jgi:hypothetical protein
MSNLPLPNPRFSGAGSPQMGREFKPSASFAAQACVKGSLCALRLKWILLMFISGSLILNSQNIVNPQKNNEEIFLARTKQLNEFIDRFNLKTDFRGNPADAAFLSAMPREKMLSMLFDLKDPRTVKGNTGFDQAYSDLKKAFIAETSGRDLKIGKFSPGVIAEARTRVTYKGQPTFVSLFLHQENAGKGGVKWVLAGVSSEVFDIFRQDTAMVRFIPPSSHETDFINLKRALEDTDHLDGYAASGFEPDFLTTFFFCIKTGLMRFEYVEKVVYHIIDIPGWYFKVEDFNRNELNSGWLISDLKRNSLSLTDFLKKL